jgi:Sulfotransferase domain
MNSAVECARTRAADAARVTRFLRGLASFRVRSNDLFISSYPRSGTTWLQHIAHVVHHDGDVGFEHISDVVPWFERQLALGRQTAGDYANMASPRLFKSHLPRRWLPRGARYVYVMRDGRDVAASYFQFYRSHLGYSGSFDAFFERFLHGQLQYGSWFKHVAGWMVSASAPDQLTLRYEQLREDLPGGLHRIASFCRIASGSETIEQLEGITGFAFMKQHESKFDHAASEPHETPVQPGHFIRSGSAGGFRTLFSPEHERRFETQLRAPICLPTLELQLAAFLH